MSILVTGGAGYIGSHVALELLSQGKRVIVLDNFSTGSREQVPLEATVIEGDIRDAALVANILRTYKVSAVIHLASLLVVPESVADPLTYYEHNVGGSITLISEALRAGVPHFIFSSSASVYGNPVSELVSEDAPLSPTHPYGASKAHVEMILHDTARAHGMRYVSLRYFNVAGADPQARSGYGLHKKPTHLVPSAVQAAAGRSSGFKMYGDDYDTPDGTCIRDYVHVTDLARAHTNALAYLVEGGDSISLNCGYGRGFSVREVLDAVKRASPRDFEVEVLPRREGDGPQLVADARLIKEVLKWEPLYNNMDTIVEHEFKWLESQRKKTFVKPHKLA